MLIEPGAYSGVALSEHRTPSSETEPCALAKTIELKPEESLARDYADRVVLERLIALREVVKPGEIADDLGAEGLGLGAVRALLASNPKRFAYHERRWLAASRLEGDERPIAERIRLIVEQFGAPISIALVAESLVREGAVEAEGADDAVRRIAATDPGIILAADGRLVWAGLAFQGQDETPARAWELYGVDAAEVAEVQKKLGKFDWFQEDAVIKALEATAPVSVKALAGAAWLAMSPDEPYAPRYFDWKAFHAELFAVPGFVLSGDGRLFPATETKKWLATAAKLSDRLVAKIEVEDAAPLELKKEDVEALVAKVVKGAESTTATSLLESQFEITPQVKTFPDDLANVMRALQGDKRVWWVGGDRFRKPASAPEYIQFLPEPFLFVQTPHLQEDGDPVDVELTDDGLSSSLRKLIAHPLAMDVNDEEIQPTPKQQPESMRLVLKSIHRELGTFPISQFPTGWFEDTPGIQELILIDRNGRELQAWLNADLRLIFGLLDWWLDQPTESGAVFSLTKTTRPNVLEFAWLDQTDPVVHITNQRMEELRDIALRSEELSTFDILREVMTHWPKGADFLALLWEVNVVRRTSRRMLASILSSYVCFYQRSGSPVWHYDHKKVEQGFDKTKKKFIAKD
jgi:hypothetical protein